MVYKVGINLFNNSGNTRATILVLMSKIELSSSNITGVKLFYELDIVKKVDKLGFFYKLIDLIGHVNISLKSYYQSHWRCTRRRRFY